MTFTDYLRDAEIRERYEKVKGFFHLRESAYDVSSKCQLRCHGCYYFEGDKYRVKDVSDAQQWKRFFETEQARGINFANLAGAEPALKPEIIAAAYETISTGCVFTNGLKRIDENIGYRIHVSIWGDSEGDPIYRPRANGRPGPQCLDAQLENYADDERVVFVYTFNANNVDQVDSVVERVASTGRKLTFNVFSAPLGTSATIDPAASLAGVQQKMIACRERHPQTVLHCDYAAHVHTRPESLFQQFGCPYPRRADPIRTAPATD